MGKNSFSLHKLHVLRKVIFSSKVAPFRAIRLFFWILGKNILLICLQESAKMRLLKIFPLLYRISSYYLRFAPPHYLTRSHFWNDQEAANVLSAIENSHFQSTHFPRKVVSNIKIIISKIRNNVFSQEEFLIRRFLEVE
jgi:hypothetical protein